MQDLATNRLGAQLWTHTIGHDATFALYPKIAPKRPFPDRGVSATYTRSSLLVANGIPKRRYSTFNLL